MPDKETDSLVMSRRKALASLGIAGISAVTGFTLAGDIGKDGSENTADEPFRQPAPTDHYEVNENDLDRSLKTMLEVIPSPGSVGWPDDNLTPMNVAAFDREKWKKDAELFGAPDRIRNAYDLNSGLGDLGEEFDDSELQVVSGIPYGQSTCGVLVGADYDEIIPELFEKGYSSMDEDADFTIYHDLAVDFNTPGREDGYNFWMALDGENVAFGEKPVDNGAGRPKKLVREIAGEAPNTEREDYSDLLQYIEENQPHLAQVNLVNIGADNFDAGTSLQATLQSLERGQIDFEVLEHRKGEGLVRTSESEREYETDTTTY